YQEANFELATKITHRVPQSADRAQTDSRPDELRELVDVAAAGCDHTATTRHEDNEKAVSTLWWKRPPTCENAGRDDRI
ncbi:hypothetical protein, partial [Streptacidiphilus pinicola]|uniref:hypothetical protein n=1 Tax=Streptacidiphilus pinicola TaxID=2219663 RepID=UPI001A9CCE68